MAMKQNLCHLLCSACLYTTQYTDRKYSHSNADALAVLPGCLSKTSSFKLALELAAYMLHGCQKNQVV